MHVSLPNQRNLTYTRCHKAAAVAGTFNNSKIITYKDRIQIRRTGANAKTNKRRKTENRPLSGLVQIQVDLLKIMLIN